MNLREYFFYEKIMVKDFAKKIGYSPNIISSYTTGKNHICWRTAKAIADGTDGKVTLEQILKDNAPSKSKKNPLTKSDV